MRKNKLGTVVLTSGLLAVSLIGGIMFKSTIESKQKIARIRRDVPWIIVAASCANASNMDFLWALGAYEANELDFGGRVWQDIRENYKVYESKAKDAISNYTRCKSKKFIVSRHPPTSTWFKDPLAKP